MRIVKEVLEFDWDKGNIGKNKKHQVEDKEAEEPFLDDNKIIFIDALHLLEKEKRFVLIGKTRKKRLLYMIFTKRGKKARIISARDINRKEVHLYEEKISVA